jgi:replicative DNA helicase
MSAIVDMDKRRELLKKKSEIEEAKIQRDYAKLEESKKLEQELEGLTLDAIEAAKGTEYAKQLIGELELSARLIKQSVPFISDKLGRLVPQIPGQVTMVGAISGTGKSTTVAAIAHRNFLLGKRTLIISNEESKQSAMARVACIEAEVSFNDYMQDLVPKEDRKKVAQKIIEVEPWVTVVDHPLASTTAERIVELLHQANSKDYAIAVIDFVQRITRSSKNPMAETVQVLYQFKDLLTDYSAVGKMPVVLMSQLKPMPPDEMERNIQDRIGWCKGLYEACSNVVEAIRLDNIPVTTFHVQKGRFSGSKKLWVPHEFQGGKFVPIDKVRLGELRGKYRLEKAEEDLGEILKDKPRTDDDA